MIKYVAGAEIVEGTICLEDIGKTLRNGLFYHKIDKSQGKAVGTVYIRISLHLMALLIARRWPMRTMMSMA